MKNIYSKTILFKFILVLFLFVFESQQVSAQEIIAMTDEIPHRVDVLSMDVSSDGKYLVSGDIEGVIVY